MNTWDFLIQADGEQTWTSLGDRAPVGEGKYRLMARTGKPHAEIDICIAYYSHSEKTPYKKRYSRLTDVKGELMIFPWFSLTVGRWQIYCRPNMMEQLCGANWQQKLTVEVGAKTVPTAAIASPTIEAKSENPITLGTTFTPKIAINPEQEAATAPINLDENPLPTALEKMEMGEIVQQSVEIPILVAEAAQIDNYLQDSLENQNVDSTLLGEESSEPEIHFESLIEDAADHATFLEKTGLEFPDFEEEDRDIGLEIFARRDLPHQSLETLPEVPLNLDELEQNLKELVHSLSPSQSAIAVSHASPETLPTETLETTPSSPVLEFLPPTQIPEPVIEAIIEPVADPIEEIEEKEKDAIAVMVSPENREFEGVAERKIVAKEADYALVSVKMETKTYVVELIDLETNATFTLDIEIEEVENGHLGKIELPQPDRMRKMLYKTSYFGHRKILPPKLYPHRSANQPNKPIQLAKFKPCPISA